MSYIVQPLSERKSDRGCNFFNLRNLTEINGHISNLQEFPVCVNLPNSTGDLVVLLRVIAVVHHGCYIAGFQSRTTVQCVSMWSGICGMIEQSVVGAVAKFVFAAALFLRFEHFNSRQRLFVTAQISVLGRSKANRGIFPGLPVDNFSHFTATKLFSQNNGFPAYFFAASSTAS